MTTGVDFLGIRIDTFDPAEAVEDMADRINAGRPARVFFLNAHCVNVARGDGHYRQCLGRAEMVLPDGSGLLLASRILGIPLRHNLNGTDLVPRLLARVASQNRTVFVLGGRPGVAAEAARRLTERMLGLRVVGHAHGYLGPADEAELMERLRLLSPDILLVGKGVPLQEEWLDRNWENLPVRLGLAVGGLIDFMAGVHPRAPRWMRALGIEWCFRLVQEPRRLARRYVVGNAVFLADVARRRIKPSPNGLTQPD